MQPAPNILTERTELLLARLRERLRDVISDALDNGEKAQGASLRIDLELTQVDELESSHPRRLKLHSEEIQLSSLLDSFPPSVQPLVRIQQEEGTENAAQSEHQRDDMSLEVQSDHLASPPDSEERVETDGSDDEDQDPDSGSQQRTSKRRKATGGLRLPPKGHSGNAEGERSVRQLKSDSRFFSKRKSHLDEGPAQMRPSSMDRLIQGIWEKIHAGPGFDLAQLGQGQIQQITLNNELDTSSQHLLDANFRRMNFLCRDVSKASQACRAVELIVQARWIDCFNARVEALAQNHEVRNMKLAIVEASQDFGWTESQLRNRMAIWNGYHQIKEAGGWSALVFSGMGIYRFCKYRVGFDHDCLQRLRTMRERFEVAADTLHPRWRTLLAVVGESSAPRFLGHPLDWVVDASHSQRTSQSLVPVPLAQTYAHLDNNFGYQHIETCVIDQTVWPNVDPRQSFSLFRFGEFYCAACEKVQSQDPRICECQCFPELFSRKVTPPAVQVFQTGNGKNNGLLACCPLKRGSAVGEFVGLVTAGLKDLDVMEGEVEGRQYQIWQGKQGNHIKFVNHSCNPNTQFQKFFWLGVERVILVSKGVDAEEEITVDYSDSYWKHLDKTCLCGSSACRYQHRNGRNNAFRSAT